MNQTSTAKSSPLGTRPITSVVLNPIPVCASRTRICTRQPSPSTLTPKASPSPAFVTAYDTGTRPPYHRSTSCLSPVDGPIRTGAMRQFASARSCFLTHSVSPADAAATAAPAHAAHTLPSTPGRYCAHQPKEATSMPHLTLVRSPSSTDPTPDPEPPASAAAVPTYFLRLAA